MGIRGLPSRMLTQLMNHMVGTVSREQRFFVPPFPPRKSPEIVPQGVCRVTRTCFPPSLSRQEVSDILSLASTAHAFMEVRSCFATFVLSIRTLRLRRVRMYPFAICLGNTGATSRSAPHFR
jgi:hypothetical protein